MDCIGRMVEILLCILCLTLVPAGSIIKNCKKQEQNAVKVRAERFYQKIRQEEGLKAEEYGQFEKFFWHFPEYNFELSVARRYVMPAKSSGDGTFDGLSVKILYREELEQMLCAGGEIFFGEDAFINISIYGKDGYYYTCGGGI